MAFAFLGGRGQEAPSREGWCHLHPVWRVVSPLSCEDSRGGQALRSGPDNLDAFTRTQRLPQQRQQVGLGPHLLEQVQRGLIDVVVRIVGRFFFQLIDQKLQLRLRDGPHKDTRLFLMQLNHPEALCLSARPRSCSAAGGQPCNRRITRTTTARISRRWRKPPRSKRRPKPKSPSTNEITTT